MTIRQTYRNGDPISLSCGCDGCSPLRINGVLCHEQGCREAWRDYAVPCRECGCEFLREERHQVICADCQNPPADDPDCDEVAEWAFTRRAWALVEDD
jgi:hypothetical protein